MKQLIKQSSTIIIAQKILDITVLLNKKYPELSRYLSEMSVKANVKLPLRKSRLIMQEYYETLVALLHAYEKELSIKKLN